MCKWLGDCIHACDGIRVCDWRTVHIYEIG